MRTKILLFTVVTILFFSTSCNRDQQPVETALSNSDCLNCDGIQEEHDRLARELESYRQLALRRQAIYEQLRRDLTDLIEGGQVQLVFRRGMIVMQLPNQILFQSGDAELSQEGAEAISTIGAAIRSIEDRRFLVAGHTDDQPIQASDWDSNWHLSSARAQVVLNVLLNAEISPDQLGVAGFGEHDPVADNSSDESRSQNRRTEIMVVPDLEQIFRSVQVATQNASAGEPRSEERTSVSLLRDHQ